MELYYQGSENKGADQLRGDREADLRLCFRLCRLLVFPWGGSNVLNLSWRCIVNIVLIHLVYFVKSLNVFIKPYE